MKSVPMKSVASKSVAFRSVSFRSVAFQSVSAFLFALLAVAIPAVGWAAVPLEVNYQGRVTVGGAPFNGNGLFRFTIANRDTSVTLWCNDGSRTGQPANSTPTAAVTLPVTNGIFNVRLGDAALANMTALPSTVFDSDRVVLRVWFDDQANGNHLLLPDRPITSVAYAFHAAKADAATTATYALRAGTAAGSMLSTQSISSNFATTATYALRAGLSTSSMLSTQSISSNYATTATVALALAGGGGGGAGIPWTEVTAASVQAVANHGYVANNATTVTVTLPTSATLAVGDIVAVSGAGAGGWKIAQNAGQKIHVRGYGVLDYSKPWTARESNRNWQGVASSADGTKLVACVSVGGQIYTSSDSGVTWTARESNRNWYGVASSADGTKLVACDFTPGQIYTSSDSGATWTARQSNREWDGVASSADGTKLVACAWGSQIYTSPDSGVTWTARESTRNWQGVASSADGTKLVADVYGGQIYTSSDSGATWTARESDRNWNRVASSADGTKLVACAWGGQIYTSSDSGVTWTARESDRNWNRVASSANGTKLVACVLGGQIYTSADSGVTCTAHESNRTWGGVASSAEGTKLVACAYGGQIYTLDAWTPITDTTVGTAGSLTGAQYDAVELQYVGGNEFLAICHNSTSGSGGSTYQFISSQTATTATVALTALTANHATSADTATTATYAATAGSANGLRGSTVAATAPTSGQVLRWNGAAWNPANTASLSHQHPVAILQANPSVLLPGETTTTLNLSLSYDPAGGSLTYAFDATGSGAGAPTSFTASPTTIASYPDSGDYLAAGWVRDGSGNVDRAEIMISVRRFWTTTVRSVDDVGKYTSLLLVNGKPAIAYYNNTSQDLMYVRANDTVGTMWGDQPTPDSGGDVGQNLSMDVINGRPAVAYRDNSNTSLKYVRANDADGNTWGAPITVDSGANVGLYTSLALVDRNPAIAYYDLANGDLKYVRANDADGATWGTPVTVDSTGNVGQCASLKVVGGNPAIAYSDVTNLNIKYVRANDATGASWGTPVTVEFSATNVTLAVVDGRPAVAYYKYNAGDLRYARANDETGASWGTYVIVDGTHFAGNSPSLAVVGGYPAIAYTHNPGSETFLRYVRASDSAGNSWGQPLVVASEGSGGATSLADINGSPGIAYYDSAHGDLKYAYVGNSGGGGGATIGVVPLAERATTATYATNAGHANTATTATVALNAAGTIHFISSVQILNLSGSSSVTWTDLNVSADAPGAKGLLLTMRMSDTGAETGDCLLQVRKKGTTWVSEAPTVKPYKNSVWSHHMFCIVECDTSQAIQYSLSASGSGTADADIFLIGYVK